MQVAMMNLGRQILRNTINGGNPGIIQSFETGTDSAVYLDVNANGVSPTPNYSAGTASIAKTIVTNDEVIITCFIPYNIALPFGNIMLKLTNNVPLAWMTFPRQYIKHTINEIEHNAGDVYQIPFVFRYPSIGSKLDLTNIQDYYAQAPVATDKTTMMDVYHNLCKQQQLDNSTYTSNLGRPVYATIAKYNYWGVPFMQLTSDTKTWGVYGGRVGDNYTYSG